MDISGLGRWKYMTKFLSAIIDGLMTMTAFPYNYPPPPPLTHLHLHFTPTKVRKEGGACPFRGASTEADMWKWDWSVHGFFHG